MFKRRIEAKIVNPMLGATIPVPTYATDGSAALDLRACIESGVTIPPGGRLLLGTGMALNMMDPGLVAIDKLDSRSLKRAANSGQIVDRWDPSALFKVADGALAQV